MLSWKPRSQLANLFACGLIPPSQGETDYQVLKREIVQQDSAVQFLKNLGPERAERGNRSDRKGAAKIQHRCNQWPVIVGA